MALIFLGVPIVLPFQVSSFTKSNCRDFIANDEWPPVHPISVHWIIRFMGTARVLSQAAIEAESVSQFKDEIQLIWSALPEKATENAVKHYRKRLQACVSANGGYFEHIM